MVRAVTFWVNTAIDAIVTGLAINMHVIDDVGLTDCFCSIRKDFNYMRSRLLYQ